MLQIVVVIRIVDQAKVHAAVQNDPNFNDLELRVICWNTSNRMHWQIFANIIYLLALFLMHIFQCKVRTFRESHKIWKNLPHGVDKSGDLLSKRQNHKEFYFKLCVLLKKSELYLPIILVE